MNINWILRLQNKTTLTTLCVAIVTAVYGVFAAVGFTPSVTEEQITNLVLTFIGVATALGIVVDPTTKGIRDSDRVMGYIKPYEE
jgi:phi LC3 family holin